MSFAAGSIEDVEAWAKAEFPGYFMEVTNIVWPLPRTVEFDGEYMDGKIILQSMLISALPLGQTITGQDVYAHILPDNGVELFGHHIIASDNKDIAYMKPVVDLADIILREPFNHTIAIVHPAGVDRLEVLIRYQCLKIGDKTAVHSKIGFFKAQFRAACRDVARAVAGEVWGDNEGDNETLPADTPPDLIADTDIAGLHDNPTATFIFNDHVHNMDESYHDFKTSILRQLGSMQTLDMNLMVQLQAQNQDLERRFAVSEEGRMKLGRELEVERTKAKTATEEVSSWKLQYEGLKETLQGALGQRL